MKNTEGKAIRLGGEQPPMRVMKNKSKNARFYEAKTAKTVFYTFFISYFINCKCLSTSLADECFTLIT